MQAVVIGDGTSSGNVHGGNLRAFADPAAAGDGRVVDKRAILDGEIIRAFAVDGAAVGFAQRSTADAAAPGAERPVADEGAAGDHGGSPGTGAGEYRPVIRIPDGASLDIGGPDLAHGAVGHERTVDDRQDTVRAIADGAAVIER